MFVCVGVNMLYFCRCWADISCAVKLYSKCAFGLKSLQCISSNDYAKKKKTVQFKSGDILVHSVIKYLLLISSTLKTLNI